MKSAKMNVDFWIGVLLGTWNTVLLGWMLDLSPLSVGIASAIVVALFLLGNFYKVERRQ